MKWTDEICEFEPAAGFDYLENALGKFDDGPFFLGQFSLVSQKFRFKVVHSDVLRNSGQLFLIYAGKESSNILFENIFIQ